jgi:hypothetical protein
MDSQKSDSTNKYDFMFFLGMFIPLACAIMLSVLLSHHAHSFDRWKNILQQLRDPKNIIPDAAILLIYSDTSWSGMIIDTLLRPATDEGFGDKRVEFACGRSGEIYSISFQKYDANAGYLLLAVVQN